MILRTFKKDDLSEIKKLENQTFKVGPYSKRMLKKIFTAPGSFNIIAEEEKSIVGYAVVLPLGDGSFDLESIAVDPTSQNKGIGRMLIREMERQMISRGGKTSILEVRDTNEKAIKFYQSNGYKIAEHMERYYKLKENLSRGAYRMVKRLQTSE
ncbi:MAG: N-acetyltransferase [Thermoplasmataceae archaeon]